MKTFGKTLMIATAAATLAAAAPALAQTADAQPSPRPSMGAGPMPFFSAADTDDDGAISRQEADAFHAQRFAQADADGDGTISPQEMQAMRAEMMSQMRDGGDGMMMGRHGGMGGQRGGHYGMHGMKGGHHGMMMGMHGDRHRGGDTAKLQRLLEVMDTDGSGAVSQDELLARFKELDANDDGAVTVAEARDGMRAAMRNARTGTAETPEAAE